MAVRLSPSDLESSKLGYANEEEFEVLAINALTDTDWRSPIINYLKDPSIVTETKVWRWRWSVYKRLIVVEKFTL